VTLSRPSVSDPRGSRLLGDSPNDGTCILFLGGAIPRDIDFPPVKLTDFGSVDNAADAYQWNMINGLEELLGAPVRIISAPFISAVPGRIRSAWVKGFSWDHWTQNAEDERRQQDVSVSFLNVLGARNLTREISVGRAIKRSLKKGDAGARRRLLVIVYAMHGPFLQQLSLIRRLRPLAEICLVVPDLPQHMRDLEHATVLVRLLKRMDMLRNRKCLALVDKYILISKRQATELEIGAGAYLVVEGMIDTRSTDTLSSPSSVHRRDDRPFRVVYTGQLNERYGVKDLVDSLERIESQQVELVICGDGEMGEYVSLRSRLDPRLRWLGRVSRQDSLFWQRSADVLVNPRQGTAEFTKYSFPSKNLEYLYAGKPVVAYRNEGMPPEYNQHFNFISAPGPEGIAQAIEGVMAMSEDERRRIGQRAKEFVETEKSVDRQMGRVLAFLGAGT
jgi:glycosyltransferase involved in cell wall biosynthesis